ncbi:alpha-N-arabinofuranosidase [Marinomonas polaris DSM 16579]|uniref:non-reducing end alpha-L-arabinofuranosidase n=1 Tax=Marinomonas polaris DSM 16579 TaxID=1122206 RepID=A0A1M5G113_9GAMM|nr:alpha-N-arabinofuranosidase [Marinomonas polaris]SHF97406.1 alpha-N-arabinofuranosidase [Marinomonas polaris DSM 16579]
MRANVTAHKDYVIAKIDPRLYGSFIEHLGRAVYSGIYEPGHATADEHGFRQDVIELIKDIDVPVTRYPGGNFVSAYNWEDGIGPKEDRPTRLDLAWHTSESNEIGIHEFAEWAEQAGTEMMLAVNLGSRGLDEARAFLEYVNHPGGSYWSDLRKQNGREEPWDVKLWCLGNEMDGPWQIGQKTAAEYGRVAFETAKAMRAFDKNIELVVCGSSSPKMPTYPEWESTVLDYTYDTVDYISLHMYFDNHEKNTANYLAKASLLDNYIDTVAAVIKATKAKKRSKHDVYISFDEWNVWYHSNEQDKKILGGNDGWPHAPALLEDIYDFADTLQVGCILNTFIRHSDVVKIGCLAQLVNVIAPIMTVKDGPAWRQSTYYPYLYASQYGRGTALNLAVQCQGYDTEFASDVSYLDISAVVSDKDGALTFFIVNRHPDESIELDLSLQGFTHQKVIMDKVMAGHALDAKNGPDAEQVAPKDGQGAAVKQQQLTASIAPMSYRMIRLGV